MSWSGIEGLPADLALPGRKAPVRLPRVDTAGFRKALSKLLETPGVPEGTFAAAISTGCALLEGAQEIVALSNRFVDPSVTVGEAREAIRQVHLEAGALLRHRNAAYALHQVAGILEPARGSPAEGDALPRIPRWKDYMTPLEAALERWGVAEAMDAERRGPLVVHWDELYDDACLLLERFFQLASVAEERAKLLASDFLRRAYSEFAKASLADHVLASHEKDVEPGKGTGLLELLAELGRAFESV